MMFALRALWHGPARKGADSLFALVSWHIWKERRCFQVTALTVLELLAVIKADAEQWISAGAKNLGVLGSGVASLSTKVVLSLPCFLSVPATASELVLYCSNLFSSNIMIHNPLAYSRKKNKSTMFHQYK